MAEHERAASVGVRAALEAKGTVERALDSLRLAVAGILASVGLSVGFGVGNGWWGVAAGLGSVVLLVILFRLPWTQNVTAKLMNWIIGIP